METNIVLTRNRLNALLDNAFQQGKNDVAERIYKEEKKKKLDVMFR